MRTYKKEKFKTKENMKNRELNKPRFIINILGENFFVTEIFDGVSIYHECWQLSGKGKNINEAKNNLLKNSQEIYMNVYKNISDKLLTSEAYNRKQWMKKINLVS